MSTVVSDASTPAYRPFHRVDMSQVAKERGVAAPLKADWLPLGLPEGGGSATQHVVPQLRAPGDAPALDSLVHTFDSLFEAGDMDREKDWAESLANVWESFQGNAEQKLHGFVPGPAPLDEGGSSNLDVDAGVGRRGVYRDDPFFELMAMYLAIKQLQSAADRDQVALNLALTREANQAQRNARSSAGTFRIFEALGQGLLTSSIAIGGATGQIKGQAKMRKADAQGRQRDQAMRQNQPWEGPDEKAIDALHKRGSKQASYGHAAMSATGLGAVLGSIVGTGTTAQENEAQRSEMAQRLAEQSGNARAEDVRNAQQEASDIRNTLKGVLERQVELANRLVANA